MGQKNQKTKIRLPTLSARVRVRRWLNSSDFERYQSPFNSLKNLSMKKSELNAPSTSSEEKTEPQPQPETQPDSRPLTPSSTKSQPKPEPQLPTPEPQLPTPEPQPPTPEPQVQPKPKRKRRKRRAPKTISMSDFPQDVWGLERFRSVLGGEYFEFTLFLAGVLLLLGEYVVINIIRYFNGEDFYLF